MTEVRSPCFGAFVDRKQLAVLACYSSLVLDARDQEISIGEIISHQEHVM